MVFSNDKELTSSTKDEQKQIETGILNTIAEISDDIEWPEGVTALDIQSIVSQLARSAAQLREKTQRKNEGLDTKD